jgi:dephospho-CoA kinase
MRNIALIGKMGSGKDTAARWLMSGQGYSRVAFADPLKALVIEADPIVKYEPAGFGPVPIHLSNVLQRMTFENAKRAYPEVRRSLQRIGQGARRVDPDFWVRRAMVTVEALTAFDLPIVVTDCRYQNEVDALKHRGFTTIRIMSDRQQYNTHESETALDGYMADFNVTNNSSESELYAQLLQII